MLLTVVFFALLNNVLSDINILLLHTNDMHAHFLPVDQDIGTCDNDTSTTCYGGFARLKNVTDQKIKEATESGRQTIYLNAGDSYQGTAYYTFFKWKIVAEMVSLLGIDVMSLGNHEFDDGISGLTPYIANVSVPIVCANLNTSLEPAMNLPNLTPSYILDINGTKIGVIGYLTPETMTGSNTGNLKILDEITYIRAEAENLTSQGVNILIALGHSGYTKDQEIAKEVTEIDLVVGGHSHTFLYNGTPPDVEVASGPYPTVVTQTSGKQVPVVQAYYATKYLGFLELDFDDSGNLLSWAGQPILLSGNWSQDTTVTEALQPYEEQISVKLKSVVGYTNVLLDNDDFKCRQHECNLGNLIADAYVDYVVRYLNSSTGWTLAAVGLTQAGGIRASIDTDNNRYDNGSITLEDVITVLPWGENIGVINITGSVLWDALEWSVTGYENFSGAFLQVSGLHVVYNLNETAGSRVVSVEVLCADCKVPEYQPLQLNKTYGVVLPQYLSDGGNNYTMFEGYSSKILGDVDYVLVSSYIENHSPVYPEIEGRIEIATNTTSLGTSLTQPWVMLFTSVLFCFESL